MDPDSIGPWIRIQEGKITPKKELTNSFSEMVNVLFRGLKASPVAWTAFKEA
jgi:hypothetical protein